VRQSHASEYLQQGVLSSAICIVAQGAKRVVLDGATFDYDEDHLIVSSVDVPVSYHLVRATAAAPFLCLRLALDPVRIAPLVPKVFPVGLPSKTPAASIGVTGTDPEVGATACRLVAALGDPSDAGLLAGLAYQELLVRLLRSPAGARIAQIAVIDSAAMGVARAIAWLRSHYKDPVRIEELAELAHMSVSSFHHHFRGVTAQSPLQYQKALRLQEARSLLLAGPLDVGAAALKVGYVSQSQFTREYSRYFGQSPTRDVSLVRGHPMMVSA
jgi:AraC-like DNA-binding protein